VATLGIRRYDTFAQFRNHMELIVREAAEAGSRLLLLPELACVGLLWMDEQASETRVPQVSAYNRRALTPRFGEYKRVLSQLAMQYKITIAGASFWLEQGERRQRRLFFKSDGTIVEQLKLHPTLGERAIYTVGGSEIKVCEVDGVRSGCSFAMTFSFPKSHGFWWTPASRFCWCLLLPTNEVYGAYITARMRVPLKINYSSAYRLDR